MISYWSVIWHTRLIFYQSYCAVTMAGEVPLLDYVTLIFYWTEVNTHKLIFNPIFVYHVWLGINRLKRH